LAKARYIQLERRTIRLAGDLKQGVALGAEAIDSGQAAATLEKLRRFGVNPAPR
jgi:anthranilate phosphoribosyltransferase